MSVANRTVSTNALWFPIAAAFAEFEELCVEARAAELAASRKRDEALILRSMRQGRTVYDADVETTEPMDLYARPAMYARAEELAKDLAFRQAHPEGADLVDLRARFRKRLVSLKAKFSEALTDHEVYYTLFPIVVYCDELVNGVTRGETAKWEPLQSELYEIDNGGEVFYSILEERLRQEETLPLVFEVFHFCLNDGFLGMYQGDLRKIEEYKTRLAERIPLKDTSSPESDQREPLPVELVDFPWRYYAAATGAVLAGYLLLLWISSTSS